MAAEGNVYTGFLYAGLMISPDGQPKVIEFNCHFGDPETQPIMLRMRSDLVAHCLAATEGRLEKETSEWDERPALGVVLAAGEVIPATTAPEMKLAVYRQQRRKGKKSFTPSPACTMVRC